jgi:tetratricopeptide (TPR) repeat protein
MMKQRKFRIQFLVLLGLIAFLAACNRDPKVQAARYLDNGNKFFAREKFKEASIMYRRALQKDLRYGEAYYRLGLTELKLQAYADAAKMLLRAVELQPNNADAMTKLADIYLVAAVQGNGANRDALFKDTKDLADKLVAQNPKSFDGHRILGQLALVRLDVPAALEEFGTANQIQPDQPDVALSYFRALTLNKQFPEAEKFALEFLQKEKSYGAMYDVLYLDYVSQKPPRIADAEKLLRLKAENNPKNGQYLVQLATHYYLSKDRAQMDSVIKSLTDDQKFPEGHLLAGDFYMFRLREFENADKEYLAGAKAFPKEKGIYAKRRVELLASTGKNREANELLADLIKEDPKDTDAIAMRAALMLSTGNRDQINLAVNDLQSLVTKTPENHLLRWNLGRALAARGDNDAAILQLEEAAKLRPDFMQARELLARLYLAKGDSKALKTSEDIIKQEPANLSAHLVHANALLNNGENDKASLELDAINKAYPQNPEARFMIGYVAFAKKDYKKAEQTFSQVYKDNPKDIRGLSLLVRTMAAQNKVPEALKQMETAVNAEPDRRDLKTTYANLLLTAEKYDESIKICQELVAKDPKAADLLFLMGEDYRRKGDLNSAIDYFRRSSQVAPNDINPLLQLGLLMEGTGKRDQAKPIYEQILKIRADHPVALNNLAYIKAEEGTDLDQALTMAQKALQQAPSSVDIADTLGWIYIKKNVSDEAVRVYKDLVNKDPNNPTFHYHFGMALMQKGDRPQAKLELQKALTLKPSKDDEQKIKELLQRS